MARFRNPNRLVLIIAAALTLSSPARAQTRTERFRFTHPSPSSVAGFNIYYGGFSGQYTQEIDVGMPARDSSGAYFVDVAFPSTVGVYVAVSAYDSSGRESARSNEKYRAAPATPPSGGGTGGGTASSAITGFALWNATSDTIIDANFTSGKKIDLTAFPCTAIQIKTNTYLNASNSPGSVKKIFNGKDLGCTTTPGTYENNAPYAWEAETGSDAYQCAPSLASTGTKTLTVVPFDGDNCTGAEGPAVSLTFDVIGGSATAPPAPTLGQPGQPILIQ